MTKKERDALAEGFVTGIKPVFEQYREKIAALEARNETLEARCQSLETRLLEIEFLTQRVADVER